uniref:FHA domain-containing protein n=1 Tax=Caenorhabditis japonica TaxID=281687 RepID=A0A8R1DZN4_CAEJA
MGRDDSPRRQSSKRDRDRSPERRRRSRSRSRDRGDRRDRRRDDSPRVKREIKEEQFSDNDSPPRRRRDDRGGDRDRERERRNERESNRDRDRRDRDRHSPPQLRDDGKRYGLEKKPEPWGNPEEPPAPKEKEKVNMGTSGALTEDTNTFRGVVIKYNEPPEAKKPNARWRLYPFKGEEALQVLYIHRQSAYLIGRDHKIADIPVGHPSCSKQHAVLQFR